MKAFQIDEVDQIEKLLLNLSTGDDPNLRVDTIRAIGAWRDNPFRPHAIARTRPTAYMYRTVMAYLDNLIAWGDSLYRQDTRESINEAMQQYVLAASILGPRPQPIPQPGKLKRQTYADLAANLDEFGNAARALEADLPFDLAPAPQPVGGHPEDEPLRSLGRSLYFGVPRNEKLLGYWDTVADRLYKIRHSLNLQGIFRELPLVEPPLDPGVLARAVAAGVDVSAIVAGTAAPLAPVRFQVLLQKALEVCQEVKSLGGQILAALEKKDNEALGNLRAKHEACLLSLTESVRYGQWQEAIKNKEAVDLSRATVGQRFEYFQRLLGRTTTAPALPTLDPIKDADLVAKNLQVSEPEVTPTALELEAVDPAGAKLISHEVEEFSKLQDAQGAQGTASTMDILASSMNVIPGFNLAIKPFGVGAGTSFGGSNIAAIFSAISAGYRGTSARASYEANLASKYGSYGRREQEWAHQSNLAATELTHLTKQLRAAELREHIAKREFENHQHQIAQAKDVQDFLVNEQRKKTTEEFYLWMKREAQGLHAHYFQFAFDVAKKTERAFRHELGDPSAAFINAGYLAGHDGLFAGEKLHLDLKRMEMAFLQLNEREYELTKHISLREWFPEQLVNLRRTSSCTIPLAEALFDLDCPGHYYRRIKSVALSVPCVVGPYASVNCSLTLKSSSIRTTPESGTDWYPKDQEDPDPERFVRFLSSSNSIVTSSSQNDAGMFETNLRDERYLPFEGAGVISTWHLALLGEPASFDYDTIADVILSVRYTARPGAIPEKVSAAAKQWLNDHAKRLFSLRHDFPSEWGRFRESKSNTPTLRFSLTDEHFPYRQRSPFAKAHTLHLAGVASTKAAIAIHIKHETLEGSTSLESPAFVPVASAADGFDPNGLYELTFDPAAVDDLWLIVDWNATVKSS